jgi:Flp pilus assembly protein TadD
MTPAPQRPRTFTAKVVSLVVSCLFCLALSAAGQDSSGEGIMMRGNRAELAVTIRNASGQAISSAASVRLLREGTPVDQGATSHGRVFFLLPGLGSYTVIVEAAGYKTAQKDVSLTVAMKVEVDISLQSDSASGDAPSAPGRPILAPKARKALLEGLKAIAEKRLDDADKKIAEAIQLAPSDPDVLYGQGVLYMSRGNWAQAQGSLEKSTQMNAENPRAFSALGMVLINQGKNEAAITPLEKSLQLEPDGWETRSALAKAYYQHEQYDDALKASQQALTDSKGKAPQIALLLAQSLTAVGRYEDSAEALRDFLKNHADRAEAATARRWLDKMAKDGKIRNNQP